MTVEGEVRTAATPVEARDASTVVLLRPAEASPFEVFVMRRRTSMAFAGGVVAFPGGGVESTDVGPVAHSWLEQLGAPSVEVAAAAVRAALRELEEETGVVLDEQALGAWDAWTTPIDQPKRYRTWFFSAVLPEGQEALELSTESSSVEWVSPAEALDRADRDEWTLMPPTYSSFLRLATYDSVEAVMASTANARVQMHTPTVEGRSVRLPAWASELAAARPGARWR